MMKFLCQRQRCHQLLAPAAGTSAVELADPNSKDAHTATNKASDELADLNSKDAHTSNNKASKADLILSNNTKKLTAGEIVNINY